MSTTTETAPLICPECSHNFVTRSRRAGLLDYLMASFAIYPFRCQLCRCRFHRRQKGLSYKRIEADRREYQRLAVHLDAAFHIGEVSAQGLVLDISMSGCSPFAWHRNPAKHRRHLAS
jgi:hypothetical protein